MNSLLLVFVVLFLGDLSSFTQAQGNDTAPPVRRIPLTQAKEKEVMQTVITMVADTVDSISEERNFTKPGRNSTRTVKSLTGNYTLGDARIMEMKGSKAEQICSGFHYKPWLVMTAASCVYNKKIDLLSVEVTYYDFTHQRFMRALVQPYRVILDPSFKPGQEKYDHAFLILRTDYNWHVEEFAEVHYSISPEFLATQNTSADMWIPDEKKEDYHVQTVQRKVTTDYNKCGELDNFKEWFCAEKKGGSEVLNKYDIGSPLYYYYGSVKRVAGLYSGRNIQKKLDGHLYNSLHPSIDWIETVITDYPTPPIV